MLPLCQSDVQSVPGLSAFVSRTGQPSIHIDRLATGHQHPGNPREITPFRINIVFHARINFSPFTVNRPATGGLVRTMAAGREHNRPTMGELMPLTIILPKATCFLFCSAAIIQATSNDVALKAAERVD